MTRECVVCGSEFTPKRKDQVTCSDSDCKRIRYSEVVLAWKRKNREKVNDYNKKWIKKHRAKLKAEKELQQKRKNFTADGYAERQKQKSLELAGRVRTTL